ncbi:uncharacterized protein LOC132293867 [Cornus florida]|uniref:uncharacterized protein LOC132293867 n=1 Tax=Cornus florida TaxID=4283 RepID=UPI00289D7AE1|nr:uncharacterized protein LOC132293867 [Cornus florida]XP_059647509.1 uncharacterized protein LOC132293867 [Cornus florida]
MEISVIADTLSVAARQGLGFANFLLRPHNSLPLFDSSSEQPSSAGNLQISALISPVDAVAPPPVKSNYLKTAPRRLVRKARRLRRKSSIGDGGEDGEDGGFSGGAGDGDGPFGGGSGGRGWNFGGFGESNWDESSWPSSSDHDFDLVYEVISWIALSNCLHFAVKKVMRIMADGFGDPEREKVPMRFPIC